MKKRQAKKNEKKLQEQVLQSRILEMMSYYCSCEDSCLECPMIKALIRSERKRKPPVWKFRTLSIPQMAPIVPTCF